MRKRTDRTRPSSTCAHVSSRPEGTSTTTRFSPSSPLDDALVERPRDERDRPVTARRRVALVVEEDDPEVGAVVLRRDDVAAVHVGVTARLEDEQAAVGVEVLAREAAPLEDRRALERRDAARHDPERLAARVVVDRLDVQWRSLNDGYRSVRSSVPSRLSRRSQAGAVELAASLNGR